MDLSRLPQPPRVPSVQGMPWGDRDVQGAIAGISAGEGRLPSSPTEVQQGGIKEAAESFASYLFAQVFSQMRPDESGEEGGLFSGETSGMFMDFFDQAMGKQFAAQGGNPLVEKLSEQLTRQAKAAEPHQP